jgi:hypothetical protein
LALFLLLVSWSATFFFRGGAVDGDPVWDMPDPRRQEEGDIVNLPGETPTGKDIYVFE